MSDNHCKVTNIITQLVVSASMVFGRFPMDERQIVGRKTPAEGDHKDLLGRGLSPSIMRRLASQST